MPTKPTKIDLPSVSTTEKQKESHKDFYSLEKEEDKDQELEATLIQKKLAELKSNFVTQEVAKTIKLSD